MNITDRIDKYLNEQRKRITIKKLIQKAEESDNHTVKKDNKTDSTIIKKHGKGAISYIIYPDGTIFNNDTRIDVLRPVKVNVAANALGLL